MIIHALSTFVFKFMHLNVFLSKPNISRLSIFNLAARMLNSTKTPSDTFSDFPPPAACPMIIRI